MTIALVTASLTAQNTFSGGVVLEGQFNFSLSGTWVATVTLQRSFDDGGTWQDVETFTANLERIGVSPETNIQFRFGIKTGDFTSGTVVGRLSR